MIKKVKLNLNFICITKKKPAKIYNKNIWSLKMRKINFFAWILVLFALLLILFLIYELTIRKFNMAKNFFYDKQKNKNISMFDGQENFSSEIIVTPSTKIIYKYYYEDLGLRNARLNFRQIDKGFIMENIIYNELLRRGYNVDVGVVSVNKTDEKGFRSKPQYEVDFVCNQGSKRIYIQSSFEIKDNQKENQERKSLINITDSFKKIIIVGDVSKPRMDDSGIITMGIYYFLLNEDSLNQ